MVIDQALTGGVKALKGQFGEQAGKFTCCVVEKDT